jgi:uncharacterized protein YdeI (YjbR/CyaY-like superfamily)
MKKVNLTSIDNLEPTVPADLRKVLVAVSKAKVIWEDLTPIARRDFISWIASTKQPETRRRRVESMPSRLMSGKRRPCCYALVPMNLYKTLATTPKAKKVWRSLSPTERRDLVSWIDEAKDSETRGNRIEKTCTMLAIGKRRL